MATQSTRRDELSNLPFKESYPTPEASARLYDELQFQRAVPDIGGGGSTFFSGKSMPRSSNSKSRCV
jgi:hypothetical protein